MRPTRLGRWLELARVAAWEIGVIVAAYYWYQLTTSGSLPVDVHAYWAANPSDLYPAGSHPTGSDAYLYSPAFELVIGWGRLLPFAVFTAIWRAILLGALIWLAGPFTALVILLIPVASEINAGNIQLLLAAAIVIGFRYPGAWAFVLLTKATSGVGLLWFVVRREWRRLLVAIGVTGAILLATLLLWPDRWASYVQFATTGASSLPAPPPYNLPLLVRLPVAALLSIVAGLRGWRWLVVIAATLALPLFFEISLSMLVGVLPFVRARGWRLIQERLAPEVA